jgi:hypothetical protein
VIVILLLLPDRAVTDDSDDEHEIGACDIQSERQIVTTKDALRAFKVITQYEDDADGAGLLYGEGPPKAIV